MIRLNVEIDYKPWNKKIKDPKKYFSKKLKKISKKLNYLKKKKNYFNYFTYQFT